MPIRIGCECGKNLAVKDELAGRRVRCPGCGIVLDVPGLAEQPDEAGVSPPDAVRTRPTRQLAGSLAKGAAALGAPFSGRLYWLLLLALVPLGVHTVFAPKDDTEERMVRTL